ncbi:hypothetical protein ACROYT_G016280 [Oculina patagonica]
MSQSIALDTRMGDKESPFRINKLNMIWKKAQNKMSEQKLSDFRRMLELQDRAELRWKDLKARGGDEDGEMEAMIRHKFSRVLEQFGLEKHLDTMEDTANEINDNKAGTGMFGDRRLSELWESVEKQGKFSPEELDDLQTEFNHHKDKLKEYNSLLKVLTDHDDISDNSVFSRNEIREKELEKLRNKLEDTHETLRKNFARLKEKTTGEKEDGLFRDPRVTELWQRAQNGKFSEDELESIKQELFHFDHKIMKHKHFKEEAEHSERLLNDGHHHMKEKHETLIKKAEEHGKWVKKMHSTLMDKVRKSEL